METLMDLPVEPQPRWRGLDTMMLIRAYEERLALLQQNGAPAPASARKRARSAWWVRWTGETGSSPIIAAPHTCLHAEPIRDV